METFFKKYLIIVLLALLALSALLFGAGASRLLASFLIAPPAPLVLQQGPEVKVSREDRGEAVLGRNVFDSSALAPPPEVEPLPAEAPEEMDLDGVELNDSLPVSELAVTVTGTVVSTIPAQSNASIRDGQEVKLYFEGDGLKDATVVAIRRGVVYVQRSGRIERLLLVDEDKAAEARRVSASPPGYRPPSAPSVASPAASSAGKDPMAAVRDGIKKTGAEEYEIDRAMLEEQLQDLNKLGSQARIIPHYKDGKSDGFKLVGIRPGSLYSFIGVRSGDVIRRVNGEELNNPSKALALYEKLRTTSNVVVDIERRGTPMSLTYNIK